MSSKPLLSTTDIQSISKCAQMYSILNGENTTESIIKQAKRICRYKKGDINYQLPTMNGLSKDISGSTILHIVSGSGSDVNEVFEELLNLGASFTIKSQLGDTALHCAFKNSYSSNDLFPSYQDDLNINSVLSTHVKFANPINPCDKNGFSHFHIACIANNIEAVEFFLKNGIDINQQVSKESKDYPEFTPLHCAVKYCCTETVEKLLKYKSDRNKKNAYGMNPLQQIVNQKIELSKSTLCLSNTGSIRKALKDENSKIEKIILLFLGINFHEKALTFESSGLSSFHIACTMKDVNRVEKLLEHVQEIDHYVNTDSQIWPGYTAMHFAAECNNINIIKLLHEREARIDIKNKEGLTPFDICVQMGWIETVINAILLKPALANMYFSDRKTTLVEFLYALKDKTKFSGYLYAFVQDIKMTLPNDSPLWPGCTPLHLAVFLSKEYEQPSTENYSRSKEETLLIEIEIIMRTRSDVIMKDANGMTPLHYAFRLKKKKVCQLLRRYYLNSANPVDNENLSHLHIACALNDESLVEKILSGDNIDVNISYLGVETLKNIEHGWTSLNCAKNENIIQILKQHGATFLDDTDTLHSACKRGDKNAVQKQLKLGADVNSALDDGRTPLHVAVNEDCPKMIKLLFKKGANLLAKDKDGNTPFSDVFAYRNVPSWNKKDMSAHQRLIVSALKQQEDLQKQLEQETGVTMLHMACHMVDVGEVKNQLQKNVNVNVRVHKDTKIWSEYTPLHVLMSKIMSELSEEEIPDFDIIVKLLLKHGSDVTLSNNDMDTPVHISSYRMDKHRVKRTKLLLKYQRDYKINPNNSDALSHFHIAVCMNDLETVTKFLEHGVIDVNQPTDYFTESSYGDTPIYMAIENLKERKDLKIVDLLLSHGADVNIENYFGNSPLQEAVRSMRSSLRLQLVEKLLSYGANNYSEDIYGATPFEYLLYSNDVSIEDIRFFLKNSFTANFNNPSEDTGYLGIILAKEDEELRQTLFEEMMKAPDVGTVNEFGRTLIHNVVAVKEPEISINEYVALFKKFKAYGYDVDDQDHEGQTALHLAAKFSNHIGISALLNMGADSNIVDKKGNTALSYTIEFCQKCRNHTPREHYHEEAIEALALHVMKLYYLDLEINLVNYSNVLTRALAILNREEIFPCNDFHFEICQAKEFKILPLSLTLNDFLSKSNAVIHYFHMSECSRNIIDKVFESIDTQFDKMLPILKLQHRKAITRFELVKQTSSLKLLIDFPLPDLCTNIILRFLSIVDLKNVVAAINLMQ